jgi:putative SOS response-associated peptidase YedK
VCGRFALFAPLDTLAAELGVEPPADEVAAALIPRYNVAPSQRIPVVRRTADGRLKLDLLQWGLVPFWAKERSIGHKLINARAESLRAKPAFREAAERRHCLIPASGFYEWAQLPNRGRQPHFVTLRDGELLMFAGLWERWRHGGDPPLETCTIVTTDANRALAPLHDRMPVVLGKADWQRWLDAATSIESCLSFARNVQEFTARPVGTGVNDPRRDDAALVEPLASAIPA